eukprot:TRINITY_DN7314_c0_g1_i1.p1 TRINITY_DN7314_c0_g1~~TRINITY_DN7314_c0_g1_i1.p1  ORF type:complete len:332 (+),score=81.99 TRINITY_DN7314_c0_g1_i1:100-996(+)
MNGKGRGRGRGRAKSDGKPKAPPKAKKGFADRQEKDKLVGDLMRYALFVDHKKIPVKRVDVSKNITKEHKNMGPVIIEAAQAKFKDIFGFELVQVPKRDSVKRQGESGEYILRNALTNKLDESIWGEIEQQHIGLLMTVLSIIYIGKGKMDEDSLWEYLRRIGMIPRELHSDFGEWEKLIQIQWPKELYLERSKTERLNKEGAPLYEYSMGPRSKMEVDKKSILEFISSMFPEGLDANVAKALELDNDALEVPDSDSDSSSSSESEDDNPRASQSNSSQRGSQRASQSQGRGRGRGKR